MKKIGQYLLAFWFLGGGLVLGTGCFILSWKLAIVVLCSWFSTWLITGLYVCFKTKTLYLIEKDKIEKAAQKKEDNYDRCRRG